MKIFYIVGPSGSGKDTIFARLVEFFKDSIKLIILYTNRPIRPGEIEELTYHYRLLEEIQELEKAGKVIEKREYNTVHGLWVYATVDDGSFDPNENYIGIGTLESLSDIQKYFGNDVVIPLFITVESGIRMQRLLNRELTGKEDYDEMCRRWLADAIDFSKDKIDARKPIFISNNENIEDAIEQAKEIIQTNIEMGVK